MIKKQTIERLIEGIRSIVSESRSSLSVEDVKLLNECIDFLEMVRQTDDPRSPVTTEIVATVIKILLQVLLSRDFEKIKDLLF